MGMTFSERLNGRKELGPKHSAEPPVPASKSREVRIPTTPQTTTEAEVPGKVDLWALKSRIQRRLVNELNPRHELNGSAQLRGAIESLFDEILAEEGAVLGRTERARLFEQITADILAFGPIEPLLHDPTITEVMVNGPHSVYIERSGKLIETDVKFEDDEHVKRIIDRIIAPLGRRCDEASPMVDARLPDGSRVNAIIPPLSLSGPVITIRKFSRDPLQIKDLIGFGALTAQIGEFLGLCVKGRLNVIVSGGTGSGKTTLLNVLSGFIPEDERIVTIEDAAELQLRQKHVVTLEKRPPNIEGRGEITIRQLVVNALRMRPDRIIVGECRSSEALDMLQAMNTGHEGSLTTIHSNGPRDTLSRIETMVLMAGTELPLKAIREQIASALDLIVHVERIYDGSRKVTSICEVQGMESDVILIQDLYKFQQTGSNGRKVVGKHTPVGVRPKFVSKLERRNITLPPSLFTPEN